MGYHATEVGIDMHVPHRWTFADSTARASATDPLTGIGYSSLDLKKLSLQVSDNTLWILTAVTPTWVAVAGSGGGGSGTVTTVSVATANGFSGTVANATTTPAITVSTSITGVLKGNGTAISAATAGTDYVAPGGSGGTPSSLTLTNATGLPLTTGVTGTLPVANGGTGLAILTAHSLQVGNGTSAITQLTVPASGTILQGVASSDPTFTATPTFGASGTLGSLSLGNATSGTVKLQPVTGALGTPTISIPATTGTMITTGDTGTVTSTMILNGAILDADVNASAAISGSKLAPQFGAQNITGTGAANRIGTPTTNDVDADTMFSSSGTAKKSVVIQMAPSQAGDVFQVQDSTGAPILQINSLLDITLTNDLGGGYFIGRGNKLTFEPQTLTESVGAIAFDCSNGTNAICTLTTNDQLSNPSNLVAGMSGIVTLYQDATGGRALTYDTAWKFQGGIAPTLSTAAGAVDFLAWFYDGTTLGANLTKGYA